MKRLDLWGALADDYAELYCNGDRKAARKAMRREMLLGVALQIGLVVLAAFVLAALP